MTSAYSGICSMHESFGGRVKFVYMCQSHIVEIVNEIEWNKWFWYVYVFIEVYMWLIRLF